MTATEALISDGYRVVLDVETGPEHYDSQGHLNNAAVAQLFNAMRINFVKDAIGPWWGETLRQEQLVVAVAEAHMLYETQAYPGEQLVGAMRYTRREGKAAIVEQRIVEASAGRPVARAWIVQLVVRDGAVVEWPEEFFRRVAVAQGNEVERRPSARRAFGPDH